MARRRQNTCSICYEDLTSMRERLKSRFEFIRARYYRVFKRDLGSPTIINWTWCHMCTQSFFVDWWEPRMDLFADKRAEIDALHREGANHGA